MKHYLVFLFGFLVNYAGSSLLKFTYPEQWSIIWSELPNIVNGLQPQLVNDAWLFIIPSMIYMMCASYCVFYWAHNAKTNAIKFFLYSLFGMISVTYIVTLSKMIAVSLYAAFG